MNKKILRVLSFLLSITLLISLCGCDSGNGGIKEVEQTNKELKIAIYGTGGGLQYALYGFRQQYPDVELIIDQEQFETNDDFGESFYTRISAEMMSGSGPDLVFITGSSVALDLSKMIRSGVFADLSAFTENDPEWEALDLNEMVMNAGKWNDGQYIIPVTYNIPLLLTTESLLQKAEFDVSTAQNYLSFLEEGVDYKAKNSAEPSLPAALIRTPLAMRPYFYNLSTDYMDFDTYEVNIDTDDIRKAQELAKEAYLYDCYVNDINSNMYGGVYCAIGLTTNEALFEYSALPLAYHLLNFRALKAVEEVPVHVPLCNLDGELVATVKDCFAVNASSANKENAYRFIKLLLETIDKDMFLELGSFVVSDQHVQAYLESFVGREDPLNLTTGESGDLKNLAALTEDDVNEYMKILDSIDTAVLQNATERVIYSEMNAYFRDEKDLDTCLSAVEEQMRIFVSE